MKLTLNNIRTHLLSILFSLLLFSNFYPQQKKQLTTDDYKLWHDLNHIEISKNGRWVTYIMDYVSGTDTLFLKNMENGLLNSYPATANGNFSANSKWYGYINEKGEMGLINLETGVQEFVPDATGYNFSFGGRFLTVYINKSDGKKKNSTQLLIKDLKTGKAHNIFFIKEFAFNLKEDILAFITENENNNSVGVVDLLNSFNTTVIAEGRKNRFFHIVLHPSGKSLAFFEEFKNEEYEQRNYLVHFYKGIRSNPELYTFNPLKTDELKEDMRISASGNCHLIISEDQERVFFDIRPQNSESRIKSRNKNHKNKSNVEIWRADDKRIYPNKKGFEWFDISPKLSAWWPKKNKFLQIGTKEQPKVILTGNQKYALTYNPKDYKPKFKHKEDYVNFYLTDLSTGKRILFLEKQLNKFSHTLVSPGGKFITYFKDAHWWTYEIATGKHTNITEFLEVPVHKVEFDRAGTPIPYGSPGWTMGDREVIVYDEYDIWLISPDGTARKKITNGRNKNIRFRIYNQNYFDQDFFGFEVREYNLKNEIVFEAYGPTTKKSGYFILSPKKGLEKIVFKEMNISALKMTNNKRKYFYTVEKFNLSPRLMLKEKNKDMEEVIVRSNPQQKNFYWGKSELVDYTNEEGGQLQGALFYPANYQAGKKYPMIVYIYEKKSQELHHYVNPSLKETNGFNITNFTAENYFVLYPDIIYKMNDPGISALDCVISAVEVVLKKGIVDKEQIGLTGHSFGGYETSFIVSQTDLFNAAVAGAPLTDLVSSYLGVIWNDKESSFWRFEGQIMRFTGSYFENVDAFFRNSPIHNAQDINTPLLTWFGDKDGQVDWYQGIEMYLALRRLQKEHVFLVYPGEGHHLYRPENQIDLYHRIKDWFDYYLKGLEPAKWILKKNTFQKSRMSKPDTLLN